jgi:hypothetical protein
MSPLAKASRRNMSAINRVGPDAVGAASTGEPTSRFPVDAAAPLGRAQDDHFAVTLVMSAPVLLSLRLCAAEAGVGEEALVALLVAEHATKLGIARLAEFSDDLHCVGRAGVARWSHKPEVAGSNPAPATIDNRERSHAGGDGDAAIPARGADPP